MESLKSTFLSSTTYLLPSFTLPKPPSKPPRLRIRSSVRPDPFSLSDGNPTKPKPKSKNPKNPLSDDNARRIIKKKAQYLSALRRNQGPRAMTPKWIKRTPEQMVKYLEDERNGELYGKHVVAAIKAVRAMGERKEGEVDVRRVMGSFVGKLSFRDMCVVLKEQRNWRQVRDFFAWMKLQLSYRPSVIVYTIVLRAYGQVGKIKLTEQTFLEMLEVGCEPDEVACGTMLCTYARWGRHKAMQSFYSAVQERGITLSTAVYNFMLSSLQKKSLHEKVIDLWRQLVDKGVAPDRFTYTVVIHSLVKGGLCEEAFKAFDEMKKLEFVPEEATYSLLISSHTKDGKWQDALNLYEDMRSRGIVPSNYTCASLLTLYYKNEDYSQALSLFTEMERNKIAVDEVIYGLLIRIYGKLGLYEDAQRTFEEIDQLGLLSDEKTYLAMAQVHLNSGNAKRALDIIEMMKSRDIWFSRFAYIVSLQCYVMSENLDAAEVTFQALAKTGLPDSGSCNDMLRLYIKLNLTGRAKKFIVQIREDQVAFDEELYRTVVRIYCKEGMLEDIGQLTKEMVTNDSYKDNKFIQTFFKAICGEPLRHQKVKGNVASNQLDSIALGYLLRLYLECKDFNNLEEILKLLLETAGSMSVLTQLISNFLKEGDLSNMKALNDQVVRLGCSVDDATIASIIGIYGKEQKLKQAQDVFTAVADSPTCGKLIYNSMIDAYIKCGKSEAAYSLYKEAFKKGHDLGAIAISKVVYSLTTSGKHQEAKEMIHLSFQDNLELDTVAYNTFIKAMLEAGKLNFATSIYEHMLSKGVSPSIQTYNTLISVYGRGRKLDKAVEMFNLAHSSGMTLDEKAYMNLICYYGKAGKRDEAFSLFIRMQEEGINPGMVSYKIMINMYASAGLCDEVEKLIEAMQRDGCSLDNSTYLSLIQAYTKCLKYAEAEQTISWMMSEAERVYKELITTGISPDLACYRAMLRGYIDYGLVEEGINFFEQIQDTAEPDKYIMSAAVHIYKYAGKEPEASSNWRSSFKTTLTTILEHCHVSFSKQTESSPLNCPIVVILWAGEELYSLLLPSRTLTGIRAGSSPIQLRELQVGGIHKVR
ncbi:hypothetical protein F383_09615 [Gossypium arboreum]|uniref:PROP1-like PPR domain-containing protein n=1 Tax=Gossypium arboreum TaxID=29729 RepID=A0A0B0PPA2_GOSAR|nr:hypothetical protein F383_09615 [Gossypium arboreum]